MHCTKKRYFTYGIFSALMITCNNKKYYSTNLCLRSYDTVNILSSASWFNICGSLLTHGLWPSSMRSTIKSVIKLTCSKSKGFNQLCWSRQKIPASAVEETEQGSYLICFNLKKNRQHTVQRFCLPCMIRSMAVWSSKHWAWRVSWQLFFIYLRE